MTETNPVKVLSDDEVSEIEARANAATEGPWTEYHRISPRGAHKQWHVGNKDGLCQITMHGHQRDYEFMAHAREDIPALCATVRALSASLSKANEVVEEAVHTNTALREQLAENARRHFDDARELERQRDELKDQLAQVEQDRDELRSRQKLTREDGERFIRQYQHAAQWEGEQLMITFENEALIAALIGDVEP